MNDKPILSRVRHKRAQERSRQAVRKPSSVSPLVVLCFFTLWSLILLILHLGRGVVVTELTPGQTAPATVLAQVDFETINLAATTIKQERSLAEVPPVLAVRDTGLKDAERTLITFFDRLREPARFEESVRLLGLNESLLTFPATFDPAIPESLLPELTRHLREAWSRGLLSRSDRETLLEGGAPTGRIQLGSAGPFLPLETIPLPTEAASAAAAALSTALSLSPEQAILLERLLADLLQPNLVLDTGATRIARNVARQNHEPVRELIRQGTRLMEARVTLNDQMIQDLRAHQQKLAQMDQGKHNLTEIIGNGLYLGVGLAVSLAFLCLLEANALKRVNRLLLWMLLTLVGLLGGKFLIYLTAGLNLFPGHLLRPLLPLALGPLLGTVLYGPRLGLAVGYASSLALSLQHDLDLSVFFCGLALAHTSVLSVRAIHKRSNLFRAGLWIGGIKAIIMIAAGNLEQVTPFIYSQQAIAAFLTGLLTSLIVLLLIPPLEFLFKATTDIRLLELSDMSHPLLARLALEAPGTYHHSLMVAHLAQAAVRDIGGNDLLVRVCAYYHDIGKLTKPEFFIENIQGRANPHDELSPSMSRLIVISHVKEGVSLAHRYKLPQLIVDGIEQHHGTSVIQYFYHRARTRADEADKSRVLAEDYRYPGPKPVAREMGVLMLADAIEAASRSLDRNKPGQIDPLVNDILREKLNDGQLDHCLLTLAEINAVRRSFIFSLNNMLHGRVAYPKEAEKEKDEN